MFYPVAMPPMYHRHYVEFRAQLQSDRQAAILGPPLTFGRWMAAQRFAAERSGIAHPVYPPRRPTLRWRFFPEAHFYLLRHLEGYRCVDAHDRHIFLWHVSNDLVMDDYLMEMFHEEGFTAGDVRRVSMIPLNNRPHRHPTL